MHSNLRSSGVDNEVVNTQSNPMTHRQPTLVNVHVLATHGCVSNGEAISKFGARKRDGAQSAIFITAVDRKENELVSKSFFFVYFFLLLTHVRITHNNNLLQMKNFLKQTNTSSVAVPMCSCVQQLS